MLALGCRGSAALFSGGETGGPQARHPTVGGHRQRRGGRIKKTSWMPPPNEAPPRPLLCRPNATKLGGAGPVHPMRKTIAERMVSSRRTSAHVTTFFEADCSGIEQFRAGRSLTYLRLSSAPSAPP